MIYEPEEDSYLLQKYVEKYAFGRVLDIGTGSGIQAIAAAKKKNVKSVLAVDINKEAIAELKKKKIEKITAQCSDLFSKVKGIFHTIIFNPPYLPNEENDSDAALDGGKYGHEMIIDFLKHAKKHLAKDGIILLVFSNKTGKEKVDEEIKKQGFAAELLEKKNLAFFEKLYVYKIIKSDEAAIINNTGIDREVFAKGKRGIIYKQGKLCIKEYNPDSSIDTLANEANFLQVLNKKNIGPKFRKFEKGKLYRDFIEGIPLQKFIESEKNGKKILKLFADILKQCRVMDELCINKTELTNPYKDIIVTKNNKPVLIDFERCKKTINPKNVTQFLQYIAKNSENLEEKGFVVDKNMLFLLGKEYKNDSSLRNFAKILRFISEHHLSRIESFKKDY